MQISTICGRIRDRVRVRARNRDRNRGGDRKQDQGLVRAFLASSPLT